MASISNTPKFMLISGYGISNGIHIIKASVRAKIDALIHVNINIDNSSHHKDSWVITYIISTHTHTGIQLTLEQHGVWEIDLLCITFDTPQVSY